LNRDPYSTYIKLDFKIYPGLNPEPPEEGTGDNGTRGQGKEWDGNKEGPGRSPSLENPVSSPAMDSEHPHQQDK